MFETRNLHLPTSARRWNELGALLSSGRRNLPCRIIESLGIEFSRFDGKVTKNGLGTFETKISPHLGRARMT
jgi:hypothetical protein